MDVGQPALRVGEERTTGPGLRGEQVAELPIDLVESEVGRVTVTECLDEQPAARVGGGQVGDSLHLLLHEHAGHRRGRAQAGVHLPHHRPIGEVDREVGEERQRHQAEERAQADQATQREAASRCADYPIAAHADGLRRSADTACSGSRDPAADPVPFAGVDPLVAGSFAAYLATRASRASLLTGLAR